MNTKRNKKMNKNGNKKERRKFNKKGKIFKKSRKKKALTLKNQKIKKVLLKPSSKTILIGDEYKRKSSTESSAEGSYMLVYRSLCPGHKVCK